MKKTPTLLFSGLLATLPTSSHGAFTLVEDFESFADGASIGSFAESSASSDTFAFETDGTTLGPNGNIVALVNDNDGGDSGGAGYSLGGAVTDGTLGTYAFDLYRTSAADGLVVGLGGGNPFTSARWAGANAVSMPGSTTIQLSVLFNRSGAAANYTNPVDSSTVSLADEAIAVFYYNVSADTYTAVSTETLAINNAEPARMWFYHIDANTLTLQVDNVRESDQLEVFAIPELSVALLGALGAFGLLRRRR